MQCILREKLLRCCSRLSEVSSIYLTESQRFVNEYLKWLVDTEQELSGLKSPLCILLQAEKSTLLAVSDGFCPDNVKNVNKSVRKVQKAVAAQSLSRISSVLYDKIESIDAEMNQHREKLCHAVAMVLSKHGEALRHVAFDQRGADFVWEHIRQMPETYQMYNYFRSKLSSADRTYLLTDILQNVTGNHTHTDRKSLRAG